jgi:hypothetical protein
VEEAEQVEASDEEVEVAELQEVVINRYYFT